MRYYSRPSFWRSKQLQQGATSMLNKTDYWDKLISVVILNMVVIYSHHTRERLRRETAEVSSSSPNFLCEAWFNLFYRTIFKWLLIRFVIIWLFFQGLCYIRFYCQHTFILRETGENWSCGFVCLSTRNPDFMRVFRQTLSNICFHATASCLIFVIKLGQIIIVTFSWLFRL